MVVKANLNWIDKVFPGVLSFKLTISLLILVDAAVALPIWIRDFVFTLVGYPAQLVPVDVYLRGLHLQALQHLICPVDCWLAWLVILQYLALQTLIDALLTFSPALVYILELAPGGVDPFAT